METTHDEMVQLAQRLSENGEMLISYESLIVNVTELIEGHIKSLNSLREQYKILENEKEHLLAMIEAKQK